MSDSEPILVPMLDLKAQFATIKDEIMPRITDVFERQAFILGTSVLSAENELAKYLGVEYALGVSSGTDALLLSMMAMGIGPGDGVITTPFTFFATVGSIVRLGARPIFADIDPETYNIDPKEIARVLASNLPVKPKAIVPVHLYGQPAAMGPIMELAKRNNLLVIEDAAQAIGTSYRMPGSINSTKIGGIGDAGCFSFFPSKNLGGAGDGGLITTNDEELAVRLRSMRTHGSHPKEKYNHLFVGGNFRLDALQAEVVSAKLPHLDDWSKARRSNAADYARLFKQTGLLEKELVSLPSQAYPENWRGHIYNQFVLRVKDRDELLKTLQNSGIGCAVYYPIPMHLLQCFEMLGGRKGDLPVAEKAADEVIAIPIYPELTDAQKQRVVQVIADFYA